MCISKSVKLTVFLVIWILIVGCSQSDSPIVTPPASQTDTQSEVNIPDDMMLLLAGTFNIDVDSGTIEIVDNRDSVVNYNVTALLAGSCPGGCFSFTITNVNGSVLTIELDLENPTSLQVYDVRLIYTNLYGKEVLNPDSYTDLITKLIKPFTAFGKENADRSFPTGPGSHDTEELLLDILPGSPGYVDYIIVAHLPGNTYDPYEINDLNVSGDLTPSGGNAQLSCIVLDHQHDVVRVQADTTIFTGGLTDFTVDPFNAQRWIGSMSNVLGVPEGLYAVLVRAQSPNVDSASTYNYFTVEVIADSSCGQAAHKYVNTFNVTGVPFNAGVFNGDITYLEAGPHAGKVLYNYDNGKLGLIDPAAADQTMIPFNTNVSFRTNFYPVVDSCPMTGRVFISMQEHANIFAPNGDDLGTWVPGVDHYIQAVEIDDNGDLWAVIRENANLYLKHFLYSASAPYYIMPAAHVTDLTGDFPPSSYWACIDLAMDFEQDIMFMFFGRWASGENYITSWDVSTGTAVLIAQRNDVFTKNINIMVGGNPMPYYMRRADMEIEHVSPEHCRIVLGANTEYSGVFHYEVARLDFDLTTIVFDDSLQVSLEIYEMPQCLTIAKVGTHPIITVPNNGETFMYFENTDW